MAAGAASWEQGGLESQGEGWFGTGKPTGKWLYLL